MKNNLLTKLFLCFALVAMAMSILLNTLGVYKTEKMLLINKRSLLYEEAQLISKEQLANYYSNSVTPKQLLSQLKTIDTFLNVQVWIVNTDGTIICDTRKPTNSVASNLYDYEPDFFEETYRDYVYYPSLMAEPMMSVSLPVTYEYQLLGYIVLNASINDIYDDTIYYTDVANICILIFLPVLALVFVLIYYYTAFPLRKLYKAAAEYSDGNYDYKFTPTGTQEFLDLGNAISYMASEINNLDEYQKKFVANISHDFRSPLTSIKGYAEAMLDGTIPYEMQDKYLNIILFESERLTKLTQGLLTLSSFDNKKSILDLSKFDINQVIKQTAATFEGTCTQKKITINLTFESKVMVVSADMGKIQQVLYNLIDNAIKFSKDNSNINISTEYRSDKIFVSVKDFGIGIPKDSIMKIWDRFYKTDLSRGKDKKGTGLGLSIVKEIIQSHNENINVISTEGVGTEFIFTLARAES